MERPRGRRGGSRVRRGGSGHPSAVGAARRRVPGGVDASFGTMSRGDSRSMISLFERRIPPPPRSRIAARQRGRGIPGRADSNGFGGATRPRNTRRGGSRRANNPRGSSVRPPRPRGRRRPSPGSGGAGRHPTNSSTTSFTRPSPGRPRGGRSGPARSPVVPLRGRPSRVHSHRSRPRMDDDDGSTTTSQSGGRGSHASARVRPAKPSSDVVLGGDDDVAPQQASPELNGVGKGLPSPSSAPPSSWGSATTPRWNKVESSHAMVESGGESMNLPKHPKDSLGSPSSTTDDDESAPLHRTMREDVNEGTTTTSSSSSSSSSTTTMKEDKDDDVSSTRPLVECSVADEAPAPSLRASNSDETLSQKRTNWLPPRPPRRGRTQTLLRSGGIMGSARSMTAHIRGEVNAPPPAKAPPSVPQKLPLQRTTEDDKDDDGDGTAKNDACARSPSTPHGDGSAAQNAHTIPLHMMGDVQFKKRGESFLSETSPDLAAAIAEAKRISSNTLPSPLSSPLEGDLPPPASPPPSPPDDDDAGGGSGDDGKCIPSSRSACDVADESDVEESSSATSTATIVAGDDGDGVDKEAVAPATTTTSGSDGAPARLRVVIDGADESPDASTRVAPDGVAPSLRHRLGGGSGDFGAVDKRGSLLVELADELRTEMGLWEGMQGKEKVRLLHAMQNEALDMEDMTREDMRKSRLSLAPVIFGTCGGKDGDGDGDGDGSIDDQSLSSIKKTVDHSSFDDVEVFSLFRDKPRKAMDMVVSRCVVQDTPPSKAWFIYSMLRDEKVDKVAAGEYLGSIAQVDVLQSFRRLFDFRCYDLDLALRKFLYFFRLPKEAQQIDRVIEAFAQQYAHGNPDEFGDSEAVYILSYSVIMLNTDQHNPMVKRRMTKEEFIKNHDTITSSDGSPLSPILLGSLFDRVSWSEIQLDCDDAVYPNVVKNSWVLVGEQIENGKKAGKKKRGGGKKKKVVSIGNRVLQWSKYWLRLVDTGLGYALYCFESVDDPRPYRMMQLKGASVRTMNFTIKDQKKFGHDRSAYVRLTFPNAVTGTASISMYLAYPNQKEREEWMKTLNYYIELTETGGDAS